MCHLHSENHTHTGAVSPMKNTEHYFPGRGGQGGGADSAWICRARIRADLVEGRCSKNETLEAVNGGACPKREIDEAHLGTDLFSFSLPFILLSVPCVVAEVLTLCLFAILAVAVAHTTSRTRIKSRVEQGYRPPNIMTTTYHLLSIKPTTWRCKSSVLLL